MEEAQSVKLSISGKITYNDDITPTQAGQIIAFIDSTSGQPAVIGQAFAPSAPQNIAAGKITATGRGTSPREVLESSGAKINAEKIVAFASLVLNEGDKDTFTVDDIRPMFRRARESAPANFSRDFETAVRSGWIDESEVKSEYYLTQEAYDAVEQGFAQVKKISSRSGSKSTKARKPVEVPEVFKGIDPIPQVQEGIELRYSAIKVVNDRFLWVLALAKSLGIDGLSNKDLAWVTDHLGAGITSNNINGNYTGAQKKGYVNKSTQTGNIRITDDGVKYLKTLKAE